MNQQPSEKTIERCKLLMAEVYKDDFNIYKCLNRVKKEMKSRVDFPPEAIIWTCEAYLKDKPAVHNHYPWFVRVLKQSSGRYFSENHVKESQKYKKEGMAQSVKDLMKGIGDG